MREEAWDSGKATETASQRAQVTAAVSETGTAVALALMRVAAKAQALARALAMALAPRKAPRLDRELVDSSAEALVLKSGATMDLELAHAWVQAWVQE